MTIQHVAGRYVVSIRSRNKARPVLMVDAAETRDDARTIENEMVAALRAGLSWPADQPAKGTLAAVLLDAWGNVGGWHQKQVGALYYAIALDFIIPIGAARKASSIKETALERFLTGREGDKDAARAIFQLLKTAADSGAVSWRPVQRRAGRIQLEPQPERRTKDYKIIPVENPGSGPRWIKIDLPKRPGE